MIISALVSIGGLDLYSLEYESLIEAIGLLNSLSLSSMPSLVLIRDSLELLQLEAGISLLVLEVDYSKFRGYVTKGWLQSIWESSYSSGIVVNIPSAIVLTSTFINNEPIIVKAANLHTF